jgi:hypothetical protein
VVTTHKGFPGGRIQRAIEAPAGDDKAAKEMMESEDEDVKVFAMDAFITLSKWIIALIEMLKEQTKLETIEMVDRNPLARRAGLDR